MIVLLNGPAGVGKDTLADMLHDRVWFERISFKNRITDIARVMLGDLWKEFNERYNDRTTKEKPWDKIGGLTPRQFYIHVSENCCKPVFGELYFGAAELENIKDVERSGEEYDFVASDSGFPQEVFPLLEESNHEVIVVRLYRDGYDYNGDSRAYLKPEDFETAIRKPIFIDVHLVENEPELAYNDILTGIRNAIR